jgi:AcrR family transcriptional regulator
MAKGPIKASTAQKVARGTPIRIGRPPKELAGQVEERILDAAREVFLARGFEGASIEEIADTARAGKPTIYARFANKEALFAAVLMRSVLSRIEQLKAEEVPSTGSVEERLAKVAVTILEWVLSSNHIGLMRLAVGESRRFPDLAAQVGSMARARGGEALAPILLELAQSDERAALPAFAPDHLATTARLFIEFTLLPLLLRALLGEDLASLRAEIGEHVRLRVAFFLAGCRHLSID